MCSEADTDVLSKFSNCALPLLNSGVISSSLRQLFAGSEDKGLPVCHVDTEFVIHIGSRTLLAVSSGRSGTHIAETDQLYGHRSQINRTLNLTGFVQMVVVENSILI